MENYQSSYGIVSRWLKAKDLIYPCDSVAEKYKYYCYDLVTARILPKVNYNWKKAAAWCRKSEKNWVKVCFQSMGRDASGYTRLDPARDPQDLPRRREHGRASASTRPRRT